MPYNTDYRIFNPYTLPREAVGPYSPYYGSPRKIDTEYWYEENTDLSKYYGASNPFLSLAQQVINDPSMIVFITDTNLIIELIQNDPNIVTFLSEEQLQNNEVLIAIIETWGSVEFIPEEKLEEIIDYCLDNCPWNISKFSVRLPSNLQWKIVSKDIENFEHIVEPDKDVQEHVLSCDWTMLIQNPTLFEFDIAEKYILQHFQEVVFQNPTLLKNFYLSEEQQILAVNSNPDSVIYMNQPICLEAQMILAKNSPMALAKISDIDPAARFEALKTHPNLFIGNYANSTTRPAIDVDPDQQIELVSKQPWMIAFINNPTFEAQIVSLYHKPECICYIKKPCMEILDVLLEAYE